MEYLSPPPIDEPPRRSSGAATAVAIALVVTVAIALGFLLARPRSGSSESWPVSSSGKPTFYYFGSSS